MIFKRNKPILSMFPVLIVLASVLYAFSRDDISVPAYTDFTDNARFVAHAGGNVGGYEGSNTLEAMQQSVDDGFMYIEVDLMTTSDGEIVLNHDWEFMYNRVPSAGRSIVSHSEFMSYKIYNLFTPVDLEGLIAFLDENSGVRIITDTKLNDYSALEIIATKYPSYRKRFIPQAYNFSDYNKIKKLGFADIIITVYAMPADIKFSPKTIADNALKYKPFAMTIPDELLMDAEYAAALNMDNINYFAHTINDPARAQALFDMGVKGIYTDTILPTDELALAPKQAGRKAHVNAELIALNDDQKKLLEPYDIYKLNEPVYINRSSIAYVDFDMVSGMFYVSETDTVYLPLAQSVSFLNGTEYTWHPEDNSLSFLFGGLRYRVRDLTEAYEVNDGNTISLVPFPDYLKIYRNIAFIHADLLKSIFNCDVFKKDDIVIIVPDDTAAPGDEIFSIASSVFKTR